MATAHTDEAFIQKVLSEVHEKGTSQLMKEWDDFVEALLEVAHHLWKYGESPLEATLTDRLTEGVMVVASLAQTMALRRIFVRITSGFRVGCDRADKIQARMVLIFLSVDRIRNALKQPWSRNVIGSYPSERFSLKRWEDLVRVEPRLEPFFNELYQPITYQFSEDVQIQRLFHVEETREWFSTLDERNSHEADQYIRDSLSVIDVNGYF